MSEVVTGPVPLPCEGQEITEITPRMFIKKFANYFQGNLPQPFRVDTASKQGYDKLREGDLLEACMVKTVRVLKTKKPDSGKIVIIPINSAITFALLPEGTDEVGLGASWEGTFTVAEMIRLTLLPPAAKVLSDCKDHDKKKVSFGIILYNLTTFTTKVLKKRGVKGVSSFGVVHKFIEGEEVQFSTRQLDTKCNLAEIYDIFKDPLRARVYCEGGTQLNHNDVVVFEEKEERTFLVAKPLNSQEPSSGVLSIPTDLTGVQVTPVRIKGYASKLLVKEKTILRRRSSLKVVQDEGNHYVDLPIRMDVRDEPNPSEFEEHEYESICSLSSQTARSMSTESLVSAMCVEMKVSYYNVPPQSSHTTDYPNKTRRRSEDIKEALYYSSPRFSMTTTIAAGTTQRSHFNRKFSADNASAYGDIDKIRIDNEPKEREKSFKEHSSGSAISFLSELGTSRSLPQLRVHPLHLPIVQEQILPEVEDNSYVHINLKTTGQGSSESLSKCTVRSLPQPRVPSLHLPTVHEQSLELKPLNPNPPSKPTLKSRVKPKPYQPPSPQTVTHEQRHPPPATLRQGYGSPNMPQISSDELRSSKIPNRGTTCTILQEDPHYCSRESEDNGYEIIETVTQPPQKPPVKPKPPKEPPNDPRFKVTPTNVQLLRHVARHTGSQWRPFCTCLELEESSLDEADHKGNSVQEKCYKALLLWLQGEGREPKWWTTVLQALRKSDLVRVALEIQHHITSGTLDK